MKITEALLAEHVVFHSVFDHVERALPRLKTLGEIHALADLLLDLLEGHSKVEEELILAPLDHCIDQLGQEENFHEEHVEIDDSLHEARRSKNVRSARRLLQAAVLASRNHFDKEERIMFPMAEKLLKSKTLSSLGQTWMEQRKAIVA